MVGKLTSSLAGQPLGAYLAGSDAPLRLVHLRGRGEPPEPWLGPIAVGHFRSVVGFGSLGARGGQPRPPTIQGNRLPDSQKSQALVCGTGLGAGNKLPRPRERLREGVGKKTASRAGNLRDTARKMHTAAIPGAGLPTPQAHARVPAPWLEKSCSKTVTIS
ncbi:hypothetical protein NN561_005715 [Cricetulus griseus]